MRIYKKDGILSYLSLKRFVVKLKWRAKEFRKDPKMSVLLKKARDVYVWRLDHFNRTLILHYTLDNYFFR